MDQERNKANLRRLYDEVMNEHRVDSADELITPDRPDHDPNLPPEFTEGRAGFKRLFTMFIAAFPDLRFDTELMVAEGDLVASYNTMQGTQQGSWAPRRRESPSRSMPPTSVGSPMTASLQSTGACSTWDR
jgi:predicted SnoaL-like aldol condensation-catalyzing enzyme